MKGRGKSEMKKRRRREVREDGGEKEGSKGREGGESKMKKRREGKVIRLQ